MVDPELNLDQLEQLESRIVPLLKRRGIVVQDIQPIGLLGRGQHSSVFSLLINNQYHVLKVYAVPSSYAREMRNRKRLIWPSPIVLNSPRTKNSLGYDLVITKVPEGEIFTSEHLLQWVMENLSQHLLELHSIRRRRSVAAQPLIDRLGKEVEGAQAIARDVKGKDGELIVLTAHRRALELIHAHRSKFRVPQSLIHNDLWWGNIIVARDEVYVIDWETVTTADYLEDLASLRVMFDHENWHKKLGGFWREKRNPAAANAFFAGILEAYAKAFDDDTLYLRLKVYLTLASLRWLNIMNVDKNKFKVNKRAKYLLEDLEWFWQEGFGS